MYATKKPSLFISPSQANRKGGKYRKEDGIFIFAIKNGGPFYARDCCLFEKEEKHKRHGFAVIVSCFLLDTVCCFPSRGAGFFLWLVI